MEKAKGGMMINCDLLDARNINEDNYKGYAQIMINCDLVLSNKHANDIMARLPMMLNCDSVIELPDYITTGLRSIDGNFRISQDEKIEENSLLKVGGNLIIENGTEDVLKNYYYLLVQGSLLCPKGLIGIMPKTSANGGIFSYPDGKEIIISENELDLDKIFALRARPHHVYFSKTAVYALDSESDIKGLSEKGVEFLTEEIFIREKDLEYAIKLVGDETKITVVPDELIYVSGDAKLDEHFIEETDGLAFVSGDLQFTKDSQLLLSRIRNIMVKGCVRVPCSMENDVTGLNITASKVILEKGRTLRGHVKVKIDRAVLEAEPDGITVIGAAFVKLSSDISPEEILKKLNFKGVAKIICGEEQEASVAAVSEGVAKIGKGYAINGDEEDGNETGGENILEQLFGGNGPMDIVKGLMNSRMVNADEYVL